MKKTVFILSAIICVLLLLCIKLVYNNYHKPYIKYRIENIEKIIITNNEAEQFEIIESNKSKLVEFFNNVPLYKSFLRKPSNETADIYIKMYDENENLIHSFQIYEANGILMENGHYSLDSFCYMKNNSLLKLEGILELN